MYENSGYAVMVFLNHNMNAV